MNKINFPPFLQGHEANLTANGSSPFPPGMMDSFLLTAGHASPLMQLFLFVYRQIGAQFGLDPSLLLTLLGVLWGLSKIFSQISALVQTFISRYFICAMSITEHDHIYSQMMNFLAQQREIASDRYLMAQTVWRSAWEEEEEMANNMVITLVSEGGNDDENAPKYLNFASQVAKSTPRYVPALGTTGFWHDGTYFRVSRKRESLMMGGFPTMKDVEEVRISCFGRDMNPIKRLLADAKSIYYHDTKQKTTIYRPRNKEQRRESSLWQQVARRPIRPMSTVVLDPQEKHEVLRDVNEYLHPRTPSWYASRGIPLRRGYLFHGPPGTGKTSFSFALAGVFGIDIYVISLQDNSVSEEDLAALFTRLPRRCVVLLEDIDTAGLRRPHDADDEKKEDDEKPAKDENVTDKDKQGDEGEKDDSKTGKDEKKSKKKKKQKKQKKEEESDSESDSDSSSSEEESHRRRRRRRSKKERYDEFGKPINSVLAFEPISLSGLLNAIDGVASHEGRILIMTTNKPESLDEALIRPGRVDVQVGFKNASSGQATELFHRMYEPSRTTKVIGKAVTFKDSTTSKTASKTKTASSSPQSTSSQNGVVKQPIAGLDVTAEALKEISEQFGQLIPDGLLSPAQIQGFLLKRKKTPRKALEDAPEWIEAALKQKESKSKVMTVQ
ncbi:BCS1 N terminal-domain-containing protein [Mariannaea sp. PMI_226]|nr:BCS1 N terminal-domain-containing protein [Mariannaea sp. PMI_226]